MKSLYIVAMILTILVLCRCVLKAKRSEKQIAVSVKWVLVAALGTAAGDLLAICAENEWLSTMGYSIFFAGMDWLLYAVLLFAMEYTGYEMKHMWKKRVMHVLLVVDTISMLLNPFFHHAFECVEVQMNQGKSFFGVMRYAPYMVHLFFCYMLAIAAFICLIYKCFITPYIYRRKYFVIVIMLMIVLVVDAVYVFFDGYVDVSILLFSVTGIAVYYYSVEYVPKEVVNHALAKVIKGMTDGVLLFDLDGRCAYANDGARNVLRLTSEDKKKLERSYALWNEKKHFAEAEDFSSDYTEMHGEEPIYMRVKFHRMKGKRGKYIGCVFVIQDRTEEMKELRRKEYQATHDKLTGLYNEECFYEEVEKYLQKNPDGEYLLVCSDVKDFKLVNDVFGREVGDDLLIRIGEEIREQIRSEDIYGRLGSDRFGLLMEKKNYREEVFVEGPAKTAHIERDISYPVNIYVGVYEIIDKTIPVSSMCDRAFMALNSIKGNFQKKVAYYDDSMRKNVLHEKELSGDFQHALETGQFQIYLQPQVSAQGEELGKVLGAEALVRWIHPVKGFIAPVEFIELFEKNGMIPKLDQYVWRQACECLQRWKEAGRENCHVSINISARDFYFIDVYKVITDLVKEYDIEPRNLKLEITETAIMMNAKKMQEIISHLQEAGFIIEMDDFGSGYSSLNMLKDISVDELKVDMKFLGKTEDEERGRKILRMVIKLANELKMPTIVEGVETIEQVDFLRGIGCDMFQGYYFAKPMPVAEFEEKYL